MAGCSDAGKHGEWRKRLERFSRSGLTVARFCIGERVSVASFYHWRNKLGQATRRRGVPARPGIFRQVAVVQAAPEVDSAAPAVVPVAPASWRSTRTAVAPAAPPGVAAASRVSIQLPCGTRIEVDAEHLDTVRAVVGEVARAHRGPETGIPSC